MALAAVVGWWMGASNNGTVYPLAFTVGVSGLAVFVAGWGYVARLPRPG